MGYLTSKKKKKWKGWDVILSVGIDWMAKVLSTVNDGIGV